MNKLILLIPIIVSVIIIGSVSTSYAAHELFDPTDVTLELTSKKTAYGLCEDLEFTVTVDYWNPHFPVIIQTKIINWDNNWGYTGYEYPETVFTTVLWSQLTNPTVTWTIDYDTLPKPHGKIFWETTAMLLPLVDESNYQYFHQAFDTVKFTTYPYHDAYHKCYPN